MEKICRTLMLIAVAVGCSPPVPRAGMSAHPRVDPPFRLVSHRDTFVRVLGAGNIKCSGTLIADDRVLTAHRCVLRRDEHGRVLEHDMAPNDIRVEVGSDDLPWGEVTVRAIVAPSCNFAYPNGDIAILVLSRHLGIRIAGVRIGAPPRPGEEFVAFGFGGCAHSSVPTPVHIERRDGVIVSLAHGWFTASICLGDFGGAAYSNGDELIGVASATLADSNKRNTSLSTFTRADVWQQLFAAAHEISMGASPSAIQPHNTCHVP